MTAHFRQAATKYNESYSGIYAPDSNITIIGDGTFSAVTHDAAIYCSNLTIGDGTEQNATNVSCESFGACIIVKYNMIVNDYSTVWACANGPTVGMNGIYVEGSLYVNGTNTTVEGRATYRPVKESAPITHTTDQKSHFRRIFQQCRFNYCRNNGIWNFDS